VALLLVGGWAAAARADEAKAPINAALLLNVLAPMSESRDAAFDRAMKESSPRQILPEGHVQPDGSVRYGSTVVTVRNPCPPGTMHYEPPPLPGRFRK